ncbi:ABC transporter substrate-binding protein [Rubrimonas cliftonensis]|uniref:NitT/TauT family transport system substrate-binding protein n=1 Tax=Rubrimonas cliftonensis TaxID=89524 RepID=A0A1H4GC28_9RHOB|nr:hypothetical protein [Rubrimonas cliftonensis]SEB07159.1 NitT/TauT family transport system substrate-binding protein [Rubrimonas cliftonensis]
MSPLRALGVALALILAPATQADEPALRVAVLKFGTVNWLTDAIRTHGLDAAEGFTLETVELAGRDGATIAFQAGSADLIVADWLWALNRRAAGEDVRFFPYSRALGALMAAPEAGVASVCDLRGKPVGVVGGAQDKSWLIYQALAARDCGFDLAAETETLFGAPPLMSRQLQIGAAAAVSTYWHYAARLRAAGAEEVIDVEGALAALGVAPAPPLVGFVWDAARTDPAMIARLDRAVRAAGALMLESDAEWERLRPLMRAGSDAEFAALRDAYRAGIIVASWTEADTEAARATYETLRAAGGEAFERSGGAFDAAAFPAPTGE